ncbi:MAG: hypothetical protein HC861_06190, partial [Rhodospirillaceae bacterium]|nr:hypothetical protein [Rhodospirillaceae bacterium]
MLAATTSNDAYLFVCGLAPAVAGALGIAPVELGNKKDNVGFGFALSVMNQQKA